VARSLGLELTTFGELEALHGVRVRTIAVCMETGELVAFGDRDDDRLLDGAMSSTALPPYPAPWRAASRRHLDGGVLSQLPLLPAIERGATQIVAINVTRVMGHAEAARGMVGIAGYALSLGIEAMTQREIDRARCAGVELRLLHLKAPAEVAFWGSAHAERLIAAGRQAAQTWLDEAPLRYRSSWSTAVRVRMARIGAGIERMAGTWGGASPPDRCHGVHFLGLPDPRAACRPYMPGGTHGGQGSEAGGDGHRPALPSGLERTRSGGNDRLPDGRYGFREYVPCTGWNALRRQGGCALVLGLVLRGILRRWL
jgi:hypothetical protein